MVVTTGAGVKLFGKDELEDITNRSNELSKVSKDNNIKWAYMKIASSANYLLANIKNAEKNAIGEPKGKKKSKKG